MPFIDGNEHCIHAPKTHWFTEMDALILGNAILLT